MISGISEIIRKAKLDNKGIVAYDNTHATKDISNAHMYDYLGTGVIHSIDGKVQNSTERMHFWRRK